MKFDFDVPAKKKLRLIINTDAKNEADDDFAIVHALLTPRFITKGIIGAHFGKEKTRTSMEESYQEVKKVLSIMKLSSEVNSYKGAENAMENEFNPIPSEGAEFIINEAMKEDDLPLYAIFLGPLTDMASALLMQPLIAKRMTVIWVGGRDYPHGGWEYNLGNDICAANVVFKSEVPLWQVPRDVYSMIRVSIAELEHKVKPCGDIGEHLFRQLVDFNDICTEGEWPMGESWVLCDSASIGLMLDPHEYCFDMRPAPIFTSDMKYIHGQNNREIRVYNSIDSRFILEDMFSKLALNYKQQ